MKKTGRVLAGVLLSLTMAVSGMAGVAPQLVTVYAEEEAEKQETITKECTYGTIPEISGYKINRIWLVTGDTKTEIELDDPSIAQDAKVIVEYIAEETDDEDNAAEGEETGQSDDVAADDSGLQNIQGDDPYIGTDEQIPEGGDETDVPAETDMPSDPEVPAGGEAPADVEAPAEGEVPADEETPAEESAPAEEVMPAADTQDAADQEEEAAPAEAKKAEEPKAAEEAAEAGEAEEAVPAEEAKENDDLLKAGELTVTFDVQGHGTAPEAQKVTSGDKAKKPADPTAEGFQFSGWFSDQACTAGKEFNFDTAITESVTVYAKWTPLTYTVTFTTARGTAPAAQTVNHGATATQPALTDVGYTCTGWTTADGTPYDFATPVKANITLTAVWRANKYTIHFDPNNNAYGTATGATADIAATYDTEAVLTKNGFTRGADWQFIGWNTAANGSGAAYVDQATVKNLTATDGATVTLYAQWKFIYKMVSGAGAYVSKLDTRGVTFQTNGFYSLFTGVAVDGTVLNANNYTASAANYGTYITLKQDFIKTLSLGQHTIQFIYADGSVSTTFTVNNSTILNPVKTGDSSNSAMWMGILAGAAVLAVGLAALKKKFKF